MPEPIKITVSPPRVVCQTLATGINAAYSVKRSIELLRTVLKKALDTIVSVRYGYVKGIDGVLGAATAMITTLAAKVADAVIDAGVPALKQIMSKIMAILMEICLMGPRALLSLIELPLEQAIQFNNAEYQRLVAARNAFKKIEYLIALLGPDDMLDQIYNQMREAVRYLNKAIPDFEKTIASTRDKNPEFNYGAFSSAMSAMRSAARVSEPSDALAAITTFQSQVDSRAEVLESQRRSDVMAAFNQRKMEALKARNERIGQWDESKGNGAIRNEAAARVAVANRQYQYDILKAESKRDAELKRIKSESQTQALADVVADMGRKAGFSTREKEANMMDVVQHLGVVGKYAMLIYVRRSIWEAYSEIGTELSKAYPLYKQSHAFSVMVYDFYDIIARTYSDLTTLIGKVSDGITVTSRPALITAKAACEAVREMYTEELSQPSENIFSTSKASIKLGAGHVTLETVNSTVDALLNNAMLQAMHMDDVADAEMAEYQAFRQRLLNIRDWDGSTGIWVATLSGSQIAPYAELAIQQLGILGLGPDALRQALIDMGSGINKLIHHNRSVASTLGSYTPPFSDGSIRIRAVLASVGLLYTFIAQGMSLLKFGATLQADAKSFTNGISAGIAGCADSYPDLFNSEAWQWYKSKSQSGSTAKNASIMAEVKPGATAKYKDAKHRLRSGKHDESIVVTAVSSPRSTGGDRDASVE